MLEQLRRNSRSLIIWVLFGIIIAAFILTFGTPSGSPMSCGGSSDSIMSVDGQEVSTSSLRFAMNTQSGPREARVQRSLDLLLVRELLAQAAVEAGFKVDTDMATEHIKRGEAYILGSRQDELFMTDGYLDYNRLKFAVQSWGLTVDQFIEEQARELLSAMMRTLISESAGASADEAKARFEHENTTVTIEAVEFRPGAYRAKLDLTEAKIAEYLAKNEAEVRKKYEEDERLYKGVGEQARIRQIVLRRSQPAEGAAPAAPTEAAPGAEAPAPAAAPSDAAGQVDAKLEAARAARQRIVGGADFAAVAAELSEDENTKRRGGDLGWRSIKAPGLGSKELSDALAALAPGGVSEVIETPNGFYILKMEDKRSGDLSFDQVKMEIAERLAGSYYAKESARAVAQAALTQVKAGKKLDELFERQAAPPPALNPSQIPPELLQQLSPEQLQQLLQPQGGEEGSIRLQSRDVPVSSLWQGAGVQPAGDRAAPAPPTAPASGTPATTPAAAAAEPPVADAAAALEPVAMPIELTGEVDKPKLQKLGPFTRDADGELPTLGTSKELMDAVFDTLQVGQVAPALYEVDGNFVLVQVTERKTPNLEEFTEEKKSEMVRDMARERGYFLLTSWLKERCQKLRDAGDIEINQAVLSQLSESPDKPLTYTPCASLLAQ